MQGRRITWGVVVATICAWSVWRATTWPIGHDEALTWLWYVRKPFSVSLTTYDANHHVLFTWLAKLAASAFSDAVWSLRLPSMVAFIVFVAASARLAARATDSPLLGWSVLIAMTCGPRTFEYGFAARGYGGALASLAVALCVLRPGARGTAAGIALGTCLGFNLSFGWAALGVGLAAWITGVLDGRGFVRLAIAGTLVSGLICAAPLAHATPDAFYFGASGVGAAADSLCFDGLLHPDGRWLLTLCTGGSPVERVEFVRVELRVLIAAVFAVIAARALKSLRNGRDADAARLPGLALTIAVACALLAHVAFALPLPRERTALWSVVLAPLAWADVARGVGVGRRVARCLCLGVAVVALLRTLSSPYFSEWWADRRAIETVERLRRDAAARGPLDPMRVGCDWRLEPSLLHAVREPDGRGAIEVVRWTTPGATPASPGAIDVDYLVVFLDQLRGIPATPGAALIERFEATALVRVR